MTKQECIDLLKLLSAMESWSCSIKERGLPGYLHDQITECVSILEREILK